MNTCALDGLSSEVPANSESPHGASVLLVDDDVSFRMSLSCLLKTSGYHVLEANNAEFAMDLAERFYPGLAIIDWGLNGNTGLGILASLREAQGAGIHTLVVGGEPSAQCRGWAYDAGADDFMAKPVDVEELTKKLRAAHRTQVETRKALRAREHAERLQLLCAEASSLLAHDINNGLAVSLGNIQLLGDDTHSWDQEQLTALRGTETALRRISVLTANFVDVSRFEDGVLSPLRTPVDISSLMRTAATVHEPLRFRQEKLISVDCPPRLLANVDAVLVERVLHNLVGNAVRYTFPNSPIDLQVLTSPSHLGNELVIAVSNEGPDVPTKLLANLFEKYRKGTDGHAMRGMGLYFCRIACEAHGGSISVSSENQITSFVIRIPNAL